MSFSKKFVCECYERSTYETHIPAPLFRKSIFLTSEVKTAAITICGLGFYDLFVNGRKITKGALAPYISNTDHIIYYDHYDLASQLVAGENVIGIMLGDGFQNGKTATWNFKNNVFNSAPKLALELSIETTRETISLDAADFHCKKGPILFNDLRSGVFYDKRLEETGWCEPGFTEDESWHAPLPAEMPRGQAKLCEAEPIAVTKELRPVSIRKGTLADYPPNTRESERNLPEGPAPKSGGYLYDFGENNTGTFRLKIKGAPGQKLHFQCAELLDEEGQLDYSNMLYYPDGYCQHDIYIVGSDQEEIFEPMFTYHGFRYLYVTGITEEQATPELLTYLVMSSDLEERGTFRCSDARTNQLYDMCRRSDISNFYYFPTDCPHREKNGWTGDASASAEHMILTIGVENSWREWMHNIRAAQAPDGRLPGIVPVGDWGYAWGNGPAWDYVIFNLPYMTYKYRGETSMITENAHMMLRYLEYISNRRDDRGIVEFGLGDWVPVGKPSDQYEVPLGFTDSVMVLEMCRMGQQMFDIVNLPLHSAFARQLGAEMYEAIRKEYIDFDTMTITSTCQSAQALGLYYDIFAPGERAAAFAQLLAIIHRDGDFITGGFLGLRTLFHVLSRFGESELAYKMIMRKEAPSYGAWVDAGFTTLAEHFGGSDILFWDSQNHHFLGDVSAWLMRYPGGLEVQNNKLVKIKPYFLDSLSYAETSHKLPDGEVKVYWQRKEDEVFLEITCPAQVRCDIELTHGWKFKESGKYCFENANSGQYLCIH